MRAVFNLTKTNPRVIAFSICSLSFQRRLRNQVTWRDPKISRQPAPRSKRAFTDDLAGRGQAENGLLWGLSEIPTSHLSPPSPPGRWVCGGRSWARSARLRACSRSPSLSLSSCPTSTTSTTGRPTRRRCRVRTSTMSRAVPSCRGP